MSCCRCCACCDDDNEGVSRLLPETSAEPVRRRVLPQHQLKNRRVRVPVNAAFAGGLVKTVYAVPGGNQLEVCEALVLMDNGQKRMFLTDSLKIIDNIKIGDFCIVKRSHNDNSYGGSFVRKAILKQTDTRAQTFSLFPHGTDFSRDFRGFEEEDFNVVKSPPGVSEEVSHSCPPISPRSLDLFLGRNKGIQGKNNSCYLDTLLFSLFAFSDTMLDGLKESACLDPIILSTLKQSIIFPLRTYHYVSYTHVEFIRNHIVKFTDNEKFEDAARDIPECIDALFGQILGWNPKLAISSTETNEYNFLSSSTLQLIDTTVMLPTTQMQLYAASCLQRFCIEKVPSLFILQLPREAQHISVTFPDLEIDLWPILYQSHKTCFSCQRNATLQFFERFDKFGLEGTFLCHSCAEQHGLDPQEARQLPEAKVLDGEEPESKMILTAVICIERSHYNCFARCGPDRWVFFDSMSDQEELLDIRIDKIEKFTIPLVEEVKSFRRWTMDAPRSFSKTGSLKNFYETLDQNSKDRAERIFKYPYMLVYERKDIH